MNIHSGDNVRIATGKDRSKTGKVIQVFPKEERVVVEGVNILKKHLRRQKSSERGQRIELPAPIAVANVRLLCSKCGKPTRVGKRKEGEKWVRVCKKCKEVL